MTGRTPLQTRSGSPRALVGAAVVPPVDAVVVTEDGGHWLPGTLRALAGQDPLVRRVVVVVTGAEDDLNEVAASARSLPGAEVLERRGASRAAAVRSALDLLSAPAPPEADQALVLLLDDDCTPRPGCLAALVEALLEQPHVAVVGPKHLDAQDPRRLVGAGRSVSASGRAPAAWGAGELDQGQQDERGDVLATVGGCLLVRADVLDRVGGPDPRLAGAEDLDLCWRVREAGHGVRVAPQAGVLDARATERGLRSRERLPFEGRALAELDPRVYSHAAVRRERAAWERDRRAAADRAARRHRRAARAVALARAPRWLVPALAARVLLGALLLPPLLVVLGRPRAARAELSDGVVALQPWRWLAGRRPGGSRARRGVRPLLVPLGESLRDVRGWGDDGLPQTPASEVLDPDLAEPGPVSDEALDLPGEDPGSAVAHHPGVLAVLAAGLVAAAAWWPVLSPDLAAVRDRGLVGGELRAAAGGSDLAWTRYLTGWSPSGLGHPETAPAWLPLLTAPAWLVEHLPGRTPSAPVAAAAALLLVLAVPAAALSAYLAGRVATRRPWPRALGALVWSTCPAVVVGLGEGRVGVAVLAVVLPALAAALARCARRAPGRSAVGGAVLASAVAASVSPLLVLPAVLLGLGLVVGGRRRGRVAGLVLVVLPVLALGPAVARWWEQPGAVLTGPGLSTSTTPAAPWTSALLWPVEPPVAGLPGPAWPPVAVALLMLPVLLAGLRGLAVAGSRGRAADVLAVALVLALGAAVAAPHLVLGRRVGPQGTSDVQAWAGTPLLVLTLALLAASLLAVPGPRDRSRPRRRVGTGLTSLVVLGLVGQVTWVLATRLDDHLEAAGRTMPPVAVDSATSALAGRYLALRPDGATVEHELLPGDPAALTTEPPRALTVDEGTADLVRDLVAGSPGGGASTAERLAERGVAFVGLEPVDDALVARLDTTQGLARLADPAGSPLWRVTARAGTDGVPVPVAAVRALDASGRPLAPVPVSGSGPRVDAELPAGARRLTVAQHPRWGSTATVRVGGDEVRPTTGTPVATYELTGQGRRVAVEPRPAHPWWSLAQLAAIVVAGVLALPLGARRTRRESR